MLIFKECGRLGNQLFQYAALKTLFPGEKEMILLGFNSLKSAFTGIEARIIDSSCSRFERSFYYRLHKFADYLSSRRVITRVKGSQSVPVIDVITGLLKKHMFVETAYFQSELLFDPEVVKKLIFDPQAMETAKNLLHRIAGEKKPVFVHIRRGDYVAWPNRSCAAVLPASHYRRCIELIKARISDPFFVFISDDTFYVEEIFGGMENSFISTGSELEDFALMSQCHAGILSASSFSWWGAWFASLKQGNGLFLAPERWGGHRQSSWYPLIFDPFRSGTSFLSFIQTI